MMATYAKAFDLGSCRDLLGKLERELVRLEYSRDRADRADHAANFAVSAWQLSSWVYAEIATRTRLQTRLADDCGIPVEDLDLEAFQRYVERSQGCPQLASCRAIATAAQRLDVAGDRSRGDRTGATGTVVMLDLSAHGFQPLMELTEWRAPNWILKCGDERVPDIELFADVLQFWSDFIHANHIA